MVGGIYDVLVDVKYHGFFFCVSFVNKLEVRGTLVWEGRTLWS